MCNLDSKEIGQELSVIYRKLKQHSRTMLGHLLWLFVSLLNFFPTVDTKKRPSLLMIVHLHLTLAH
jgi:hypothetical protein